MEPTADANDCNTQQAETNTDASPDPVTSGSMTCHDNGEVADLPISTYTSTLTRIHEHDLNPHDVLSGRGGAVNGHPGNIQFREIVKERRDEYALAVDERGKADHNKKNLIAEQVIDVVYGQSPPGRFLRRDPTDSTKEWWIPAKAEKILAKVSQALREGAPAKREEFGLPNRKKRTLSKKTDEPSMANEQSTVANKNHAFKPCKVTSDGECIKRSRVDPIEFEASPDQEPSLSSVSLEDFDTSDIEVDLEKEEPFTPDIFNDLWFLDEEEPAYAETNDKPREFDSTTHENFIELLTTDELLPDLLRSIEETLA